MVPYDEFAHRACGKRHTCLLIHNRGIDLPEGQADRAGVALLRQGIAVRDRACLREVVPIALIQILLWAPFPDYESWAGFFTWLLIFVYGFLLVADPRFALAIQWQGKYALGLALVCILVLLSGNVTGLFGGLGQAADYSAGYVWVQLLLSLTTWSLLLSALWLGMRFLNTNNTVTHYANEAVLPFYIHH